MIHSSYLLSGFEMCRSMSQAYGDVQHSVMLQELLLSISTCPLCLRAADMQVGVRVLSCQGSGTLSNLLSAINWVTTACPNTASKKCVVNMSLGFGGIVQQVDDAVQSSISQGLVYAIAAGNSNADACNTSPARAAGAITVGATDSSDARAYFSNYGRCECGVSCRHGCPHHGGHLHHTMRHACG